MARAGISRLVECGPGKVLSGLNRRIDKSLESYNIEEPADFETTMSALAGETA
jgi:[acyl-carrier-protein] S-malonyltransferase